MESKENMETGTETEQRTSHWDQPWKTEAREIDPERQGRALIMQMAVKTTKLVKIPAPRSIRVPENAF